ncbi:MAG: polysaccharide biosynthesis protein [Clostridia bacterium]|nr:polysaccharide biosynthesis protein [Clostridia bacterium]
MILTVSNLLVKTAGLFFKIPMNFIVGDTGMGYYHSAYSIYTLFYMLSTSGLPVALSVMISESRAEGKIVSAKRIYRTALSAFVLTGCAAAALMLFGAGSLADLIRSEKSALSIAVIAPTMLFICISSALRGYFQGCGNMIPTAVSQFIEAMGKLMIGVAAASFAIRCGYPIEMVAAFAAAGLTCGSLLGTVYLLIEKLLRRDRDLLADGTEILYEKTPYRTILVRFLKISVPVTISASVMSLTNTIDTVMIQRILSETMTEEAAAALYGNYTSLAVPMFNLPPVLVYPIAYALVPAVAAAYSSKRSKEAGERIESALRYAVIIGLPCAFGLAVLAEPVLCLFYRDASAHTAASLLTLLAPSSFFVCILAVTNSVLQACGEERKPVFSMLCGAAVKCVSGALLLRRYGIAGAPVSTFLCYLTVTVINFAFVVRVSGIRLHFHRVFLRPLVGSVLCALSALLIYHMTKICLLAVLGAVLVYAAVILWTGAVTKEEIRLLLVRGKGKDVSIERKNTELKE